MKKATPSHNGAKTAAAAFYEIAVRTGGFSAAGTDGDVWVWIDGTGGRSGWLYLDNSDDNFERNNTDYFNFVLNDLGYVQTAYVYFSPGGWWPDWYLNYVTVNGAYFPAYRWFTNSGYVALSRA
jgi:PLAT/LH2 domain